MINNRLIIFFIISSIIILLIIPTINSLNIFIADKTIQHNEELSYDFTIIWISDTQFYSQKYPFIFNNITDWITTKKYELNISYVIHTGDIIQNFLNLKEWMHASQSMKILEDNQLLYGILAGNHDNRDGMVHFFYNLFFGKWRFVDKQFYGGSFYGNQNHYDLFSSNNIDFIIIYLSYKINDIEFNWANSVLQQHKDCLAIIATHEYIEKGGNYSGQGEDIFNKLVVPNNNIFMILCGHKHNVELNTKNIDGRTIYEILANYQAEPNGGSGYIRLLHFSIDDELIYIKTYSPYLNDYNYHEPEEDEFTLVFKP